MIEKSVDGSLLIYNNIGNEFKKNEIGMGISDNDALYHTRMRTNMEMKEGISYPKESYFLLENAFIDMNGDNKPDRISKANGTSSISVYFNHNDSFQTKPTPWNDFDLYACQYTKSKDQSVLESGVFMYIRRIQKYQPIIWI